jgi:hypothetical protein
VFPPETKSFNNQMASSVDRTTKQKDNETSIAGSLFDLPCVDHYHTTSSFYRLAVKYYLLHGAMA